VTVDRQQLTWVCGAELVLCLVRCRGLKDLRQLTLDLTNQSLTGLEGTVEVLRQLTGLESVDLGYISLEEAARDSQLWGSIPRLTGIRVWNGVMLTDEAGAPLQQKVTRSLSALTQLTRLELTLTDKPIIYHHQSSTPVCRNFAKLTRLRRLNLECVGGGQLPQRDCLDLMQLHQLTSLTLNSVGKAVDDAVAVALACNMPQLCHLDLTQAGLSTDASMAALAQLRHLTRLVLTGNSVITNDKRCVTRLQRYRRMAGLPELVVLR
jgi:hypothetical protein